MKIFINYPFGNTELEARIRNKKLFSVKMEEGFNSRKILDTCLSHKEPLKFIPYLERIEQSSHNHYAICFCSLIENTAGMKVDYLVQVIRTIFLELERVYSHTLYLNRLFSYTENPVAINHTITIKDSLLNCFEEVSGHRMFGTNHVFGDINFNISSGNIKFINATLEQAILSLNKIKKIADNNPSMTSLFKDSVVITEKSILDKKITGPFSWFKDLNKDTRSTESQFAYIEPDVQKKLEYKKTDQNCIYFRMWRIIYDVENSIKIIKSLLEKYHPVYQRKMVLERPFLPEGKYSNTIESPRGIIGMGIEVDKHGTIIKIHIDSPSDTNKGVLNDALNGTLVDHINLAFDSLYISMMEIDK